MRTDKFEKDLDSVSNGERRVLLSMAKLDDVVSPHQIKAKNARMCLSSLCDKGVVTKLGRGKYRLYHLLFKYYLLKL